MTTTGGRRPPRTPRRSRHATAAQTRALAENSRALVGQLRSELGVPERPAGHAALVMLMGFPGVGKTHCARLMAARLGAATVATDHLRSRLFIAASYADDENRALFGIAEALVDELLSEGHVVILDATNLLARYRAPMESVAARRGVATHHVLVVSADEEARARLSARATARADGDHSDADVGVYDRMRERGFETPDHFIELHNGPDVAREIERVARSIA